MVRVLLLTVLTAAIALDAPAQAATEKDGTPPGMVAFFTTRDCPAGWMAAANAAGRLLVGTTSSPEVNVTVGTPLRPATPPSHEHAFITRITVPNWGIAAVIGCCNDTVAPSGTFDADSGNTQAGTGDLPFVQLTACRKTAGPPPVADPYPFSTVSFFDAAQCPAGWNSFRMAEGRTIVANSDTLSTAGKPLAPHQIHRHRHNALGTFALDRVSLAAANGRERGLAVAGKATAGATVSAVDSNVPYLQLLSCIKAEKKAAGLPPPPGVIAFNAEPCTAPWEEARGLTGRYVVGLPPGGTSGVAFGGLPLRSEEVRTHTHRIIGAWTPRKQGVAAVSGCCNDSFGGHRTYSYTVTTDADSAMLPYIQLAPCTPK